MVFTQELSTTFAPRSPTNAFQGGDDRLWLIHPCPLGKWVIPTTCNVQWTFWRKCFRAQEAAVSEILTVQTRLWKTSLNNLISDYDCLSKSLNAKRNEERMRKNWENETSASLRYDNIVTFDCKLENELKLKEDGKTCTVIRLQNKICGNDTHQRQSQLCISRHISILDLLIECIRSKNNE